jgi:hypothetical protein
MGDNTKNACDACAILGAGLTFFYENAPQIAAVLSVLWLLLRIIEWGVRAYRGFPGKGEE